MSVSCDIAHLDYVKMFADRFEESLARFTCVYGPKLTL